MGIDNPKFQQALLNEALEHVVTGYTFFRNLEELYVDLQAVNLGHNAEVDSYNSRKYTPSKFFRGFTGGGVLTLYENGNMDADTFKENYASRIELFESVIADHKGLGYSSEYGLLYNLYEGLWHLLTGKKGFFLQTPEEYKAQTEKAIGKLAPKLTLLELEPEDNAEKISKLKSAMETLDITDAILSMKELELYIKKMEDLLGAGISQSKK